MGNNLTHGKNLDIEVLRAYAISITIVAHLGLLVPEWYTWTSYFWLGGGVDLFFCISGLLISRSLLNSFDKKQNFTAIATSFWVRRVFRLWPAALCWSTLALVLSLAFDVSRTFGAPEAMLRSWLFGVLNLQNLYIWQAAAVVDPNPATPLWHYWSLSLEEQYYFILPLVLALVTKRSVLILAVVMLALYQAVQIRPWGSLGWFTRSDALLLGTAIGLMWHNYPIFLEKLLSTCGEKIFGVIMMICLPLPVIFSKPDFSPYYMGIVAVSSSSVVLLASYDLNLLARAGRFKDVAIYIGARSYSIYLVHYPVFGFVREFSLSMGISELMTESHRIAALICSLLITMLLAEFSYRYIETPLRSRGVEVSRRWGYRTVAK